MAAKILPFSSAAQLIDDHSVVTVSSSSGLACPDRMLSAIGARFQAERHPHSLTLIHPIAAGDMYGIKGIDHLAQPGQIKRVIAGSYPSGPSSLPAPRIWYSPRASCLHQCDQTPGHEPDNSSALSERTQGIYNLIP